MSFNKANGRTILVSAAMIDSSELIVAILRKYPLCYEELGNCKLIHFQEATFKNTTLHWAIANSNISTALTLMDNDIITDPEDMDRQINAVDCWGKTPLMFAIAKGPSHQDDMFGGPAQSLIIDRLLALSADVTAQDCKGQTALHFAVAHRDIALVIKLIKAGGDIHQPDHQGNTPLHMANLTEAQADSLFAEKALSFTREIAKWHNSETTFKKSLEELAGQSIVAMTPVLWDLPSYEANVLTEIEKENKRKFCFESRKKIVERGLKLCAGASASQGLADKTSKYFRFYKESAFQKSATIIEDVQKVTTEMSNATLA